MKNRELTARQAEIFTAIRAHIRENGRAPSRKQLAHAVGLQSQAAIDSHLQALERKGWVELIPGRYRGINLLRSDTPIVDTDDVPFVAAGTPILAEEGMQPDKASMQALWSTFGQTPDYFLRVRGDSMDRTGIRDGDVVAVRRNPAPRDGDVVVARIGNEITMKRFRATRGDGELRPESTNEDHGTIWLDNEPDSEIVGIVVGAIIATPPNEEATGT